MTGGPFWFRSLVRSPGLTWKPPKAQPSQPGLQLVTPQPLVQLLSPDPRYVSGHPSAKAAVRVSCQAKWQGRRLGGCGWQQPSPPRTGWQQALFAFPESCLPPHPPGRRGGRARLCVHQAMGPAYTQRGIELHQGGHEEQTRWLGSSELSLPHWCQAQQQGPPPPPPHCPVPRSR